MDPLYKEKFVHYPDIDPQQFVEYFNLEFGISESEKSFTKEDFSFVGIHAQDGIETMFWSVKGVEIYALVKPFEDSFIIEMGRGSNE